MTDKPSNPPAFPNTGNSTWNLIPADGMTLRDWFAGQAIAGILAANPDMPGMPATDTAKALAAAAYCTADAMLAERERKD